MNISELSLKELQNLKREINVRIQMLGQPLYKVGQKVGVDHRNHLGETFVITKVNRVKCKIESKNTGQRFTCPKSMLLVK